MIKAVLWDNDGVLVDTETLFFEITRQAFAELGVSLTKEIWGKRYLSDGRPSREIAAELGANPSRIAPVLEARNQQYRRILAEPPVIRTGVRETLSALAATVRLAIVTGCDREQLDLVHRSTNLLGFFKVIVTSDDCAHAKPHPELYLTALRALNLCPNECLAIEDSPRGLASARAASVACVVVPTELTAGLDFEGAISIEKDVSGVLHILKTADSPRL
jgi:HAD superfamily hydrolase (TIGR01509 family)